MENEGNRRLDNSRRYIDLFERYRQLSPERQEEFMTKLEKLIAAAEQTALTIDQAPAPGRA